MVKLRLTRLGRKKVPFYRIAAMEALSKRDGILTKAGIWAKFQENKKK